MRFLMAESDEKRREHERDRAQEFDQHVQAWARGIFERISDGVAHNRRFVGIRAFAAVLAGLDEFLRIVPGAATVV